MGVPDHPAPRYRPHAIDQDNNLTETTGFETIL